MSGTCDIKESRGDRGKKQSSGQPESVKSDRTESSAGVAHRVYSMPTRLEQADANEPHEQWEQRDENLRTRSHTNAA